MSFRWARIFVLRGKHSDFWCNDVTKRDVLYNYGTLQMQFGIAQWNFWWKLRKIFNSLDRL